MRKTTKKDNDLRRAAARRAIRQAKIPKRRLALLIGVADSRVREWLSGSRVIPEVRLQQMLTACESYTAKGDLESA